jgi:tetratricopeptide (TPR) repeat protein
MSDGIDIGENFDDINTQLNVATHISNTLIYMASFDEGFAKATNTLEIAERYDHKLFISELNAFPIPSYYMSKGEINKAKLILEEGYSIAKKIKAAGNEFHALNNLSEINIMQGEYSKAIGHINQAMNAAQRSGFNAYIASSFASRAYLHLQIGSSQEIIDSYIKQMLNAMKMPIGDFRSAHQWIVLGNYYLANNEFQKAVEQFDKVINAPTLLRNLYEGLAFLSISKISLDSNNIEEAEVYLKKAKLSFEEKKFELYSPYVKLIEGLIAKASNNNETAIKNFELTISIAEDRNMLPLIWQTKLELAGLIPDKKDRLLNEVDEVIKQLANQFEDSELRSNYIKFVESFIANGIANY